MLAFFFSPLCSFHLGLFFASLGPKFNLSRDDCILLSEAQLALIIIISYNFGYILFLVFYFKH